MKKSEELQQELADIEKTLKSPGTLANELPGLNKTKEKLEAKIKKALEEEGNEEAAAEFALQQKKEKEASDLLIQQEKEAFQAELLAQEAEEKAEKKRQKAEAKAAKLAEKEQAKKDKKAKRTPEQAQKITRDNLDGCLETLKQHQFRVTKISESQSQKSPVHRKLSTVVADKVSNTITAALRKEITKENIKRIDVDAWKDVKSDGIKFLKSLRKASGGIADDNAEMIKRFTASFDELLDEILAKKEEWSEAA